MSDLQSLLDALQHPEPAIRLPAIHALAEFSYPLAVDALKRLLWDDTKIATHAATLRALGRIGRAGGVDALEPVIRALDHDHATVRDTAAHILGEMGDPAAVGPLIRVLQAGEGVLRASAAEALGKLGDAAAKAGAVEPLMHALQRDDRGDVRFFAAQALGRLGDAAAKASAVDALIAALDDPGTIYSGSVAEAAAEALEHIGTDAARAAADQWRDLWAIPGDTSQAETLIARLVNDAWEARHIAATMLGDLGDIRAVDPLIAALEDADPAVQSAAAEALGKLGDPRAVGPLVEALKSHLVDLRRAAIGALGMLEDVRAEHAVDALIDMLHVTEGDLDFAAAAALDQIGGKAAERALTHWRKETDRNPRFPPSPDE